MESPRLSSLIRRFSYLPINANFVPYLRSPIESHPSGTSPHLYMYDISHLTKELNMAKSDPLSNLNKETPMADNQQLNDLHDHLVRLQKQVDEQQIVILSLQEATPDISAPSFYGKVWETVMMGTLSASLGPNKVIQDTPKAMQQMIGRALRLADAGVEAAKAYQKDQELQRKDKEVAQNNDPLKQLLQ